MWSSQLSEWCWFSGWTGAGTQTDSELHQTGGERSLCAGVHAGISGGSAGVPPNIEGSGEYLFVIIALATTATSSSTLTFDACVSLQYAGINIGPVHKKDVMKASTMLEHDLQYVPLLHFINMANLLQATVETAISWLFSVRTDTQWSLHLTSKSRGRPRKWQTAWGSRYSRLTSSTTCLTLSPSTGRNTRRPSRRSSSKRTFPIPRELKTPPADWCYVLRHIAVFPVKLRILPQFIFNSRDPIVMGVCIDAGVLRQGTPLCVPSKGVSHTQTKCIYLSLGLIQVDYTRFASFYSLWTLAWSLALSWITKILTAPRKARKCVSRSSPFPGSLPRCTAAILKPPTWSSVRWGRKEPPERRVYFTCLSVLEMEVQFLYRY